MTQNVWRCWLRNTTDRASKAFENDVKNPEYDLSPVIKNEKQKDIVNNILQRNFNLIDNCFK